MSSSTTSPKSSSRNGADDREPDAPAAGRKPDATVAFGNIRVSGWLSEKGWSFVASRSYRDQAGETQFSQMQLFLRDILPMARALEVMADKLMRIEMSGQQDDAPGE
jgi:hypothetical protein